MTDPGVRADLADRADQVIRTFYRAFALSVGGRVVERDGVVACLGVHPSPIVTNTAWRSDPSTDPATVLRIVEAIYAGAGFVGSLMTSSRSDADLEAAARQAGRRVVVELPVMVVERASRPSPSPGPPAATMPTAATAATAPPAATTPPAVTVRRIEPVADLGVFRTILIDGFFEGDDGGRSLIDATFASPSSLTGSGVGAFLAELDGQAVSVAGAWRLGDDAAIGWVATIPSARRRGLGALVTARAVDFAFDHGAGLAVLQASPSGRPVYERLGFATVGLDRIWEPPGARG